MSFFKMKSEYENRKQIGRECFLQNAKGNLTPKGLALLDRLLLDYQIEYVVHCLGGGEILMANAAIASNSLDDLYNVSNYLSRCIPHDCIIVLHGDKYGKIYTSSVKIQKNENIDKGDKQEASFTFRLEECPEEINRLLNLIAATPTARMTARQVLNDWNCCIYRANVQHKRNRLRIIANRYESIGEEAVDAEIRYRISEEKFYANLFYED